MSTADFERRALLVGVGGAVVGTMVASRSRAASPRQVAEHQAILDKIARTDQGFGECCLPVQAFPGNGTSMFRLTEPGSYYLADNVVATDGLNGIEIDGSHVDLDLNGYSVLGGTDAAGLPAGTGILAVGSNIAVYDGSVVAFDRGVDFGGATYSILWDVTAIDGRSVAFIVGAFNQHYDNEAHRYRSGTGFAAQGTGSEIRECGAYTCAAGFRIEGSKNLVLGNSATDCPVPFTIGGANAWGPIVTAAGDLSTVANASNVNANLIY